MTDYEALGIVLDLASQNALDEQDAEIENMQEQYEYQQEAFRVIGELWDRLEPENV
jgi:hypothetical protein